MSYKLNDLIKVVALDLNEMGLGQDVSPEAADNLTFRAKSIKSHLEAMGKLYLPSLDEIPDAVFEPLCKVMVLRLAPTYGLGDPQPNVLEFHEDRLKEASAPVAAQKLLTTDPVLRRGARGATFNWRRGF